MPATTPIYGLPYPLLGDPVKHGASDIQHLAEELERQMSNLNVPPPTDTDAPTESVRMVRTNGQGVPDGTDTFVEWQSADWDTTPAGSAQWYLGGFLCRVSGIYSITAVWPWDANSNGRRNMKILKNGTTPNSDAIVGDAIPATAWENITSVADQIALNAGDELRMVVAQDSGVTLYGGHRASSAVNITASMSLTLLRPLA